MTEQNAVSGNNETVTGNEAPKKLAGKFDTPEALEAAYKELETKLGTSAQAVDKDALATAREAHKLLGEDGLSPEQKALVKQHGLEDKPAPKAEEKKADGANENHGTKPEHAGLPKGTDFGTFDTLVSKGFKADEVKGFMSKMADGTFADADAKAIADKMGVPVEAVKGYVEPRMKAATADAGPVKHNYTPVEIATVQKIAGGEEGFAQLSAWAKTALTPAELKAYNDAVDAGPVIAQLAVEGLKARHVKAVGEAPARRVGGDSASVQATDTYENNAELARAISDPRYRTEPKYRAAVEAKAARSNFR